MLQPMTMTELAAHKARRMSIGFLNWAHALDHYVILIYPTVVIGLALVYGRTYADLIALGWKQNRGDFYIAIAASLAAKKRLQVTAGTMPTHGPLFVSLLVGTVLLIGVLNYVPALALGPVAEHLQLFAH